VGVAVPGGSGEQYENAKINSTPKIKIYRNSRLQHRDPILLRLSC
jgi:hypothetical protein